MAETDQISIPDIASTILEFEFSEAEFVIGLVSPVGSDNRSVEIALQNGLERFGYKVHPIRISAFLKRLNLEMDLPDSPEYDRIRSRIKAGDAACERAEREDFLALLAVSEINKERSIDVTTKIPSPRAKTVHIISTLKRPEEAITLRRIYGAGFLLVGIFATQEERLTYLTDDKNIPKHQAEELIQVDTGESERYGQGTRDTFHLADVFVRLKGDAYKRQLWRFLDLLMGDPFSTPTHEEHAMFLAHSAGLRSADLSRQIGAIIVSPSGDIIGSGCNDVPCAGGGQYWQGRDDQRDYNFKGGYDSNEKTRDEFIVDVVAKLLPDVPEKERLSYGKTRLKNSPLLDITEFGRPVHAEMEALLSCARIGCSPRSATLYCTTFPCHNCTKHIIGAGIERVVYIEPYPKSRASELHSDAILLEEQAEASHTSRKVKYQPFVGVGPRRYSDLFSLVLNSGKRIRRKHSGRSGQKKTWERAGAMPRVPMLPSSYLQREVAAVQTIKTTVEKLRKTDA